MNRKAQSGINRKLKVLTHAKQTGHISQTCRSFGILRESFYKWRRADQAKGESGLINHKPCPENPKLRTAQGIEEKILYWRKHYHFGPINYPAASGRGIRGKIEFARFALRMYL